MANPHSIDDLVSAWEPKLQRAFLDAIAKLRAHADVSQIAAMLEKQDVAGALRAVGLDPVSFRVFDRVFTDAFEAGGIATAALIPIAKAADGFRTVFQFNIRNPAAEAWLKSYSSNLVKDVIDDQRQMIRNSLEAGLKAGANPKTTALDLVGRVGATGSREGGLIGLTDSQAQWVRNYAQELASDNPRAALDRTLRDARFDKSVISAAESGEPLSADLQASMVRSYTNRALRFRAEAIARTETMTALHTAQEQAVEQAVQGGTVHRDKVSFIWRATKDNRTREAHRDLDGQTARMGEAFQSELGPIRYPGDPEASIENTANCRCWRELNVSFLKGLR